MNGGLSNELSVHPSSDPSTKLDGSFISYNEQCNRKKSDIIILTIHIPSNGITSWKAAAISVHHWTVLGFVKSGNAVFPGQTFRKCIDEDRSQI